MYIYSIIFMTNKSVMTFLYVNKYLSVCLSGKLLKRYIREFEFLLKIVYRDPQL